MKKVLEKAKKSKDEKAVEKQNGAVGNNTETSSESKPSLKAISQASKGAMKMLKETDFNIRIRSVGMKLFLIIFCGIIACVLSVGLMSYSKSKDIIESKVSDGSYQTVNQVANNLDVIFKTYEDLTLQILIDKNMQKMTDILLDDGDEYAKFEATRDLGELLQSYLYSNDTLIGMMLLPINPKLDIVTAGASTNSSISNGTELLEMEWYKQTIEMGGKTNWLANQADRELFYADLQTISVSRMLKDPITNEPTYVLLIDIDLKTLTNRYQDVVLGEGSEMAMIDDKGNYIAAADPALVGKASLITFPSEGELAKQGSEKVNTAAGEDVLAAYKTFKTMNWKLVGTIPVDELVTDAKAIQTLTWITVFFAALIAIAIGGYVVFTVAVPLVSLRNLMNEGARGNLTVRSTIKKRADEIGELSLSFNKMMSQIKELAVQTTSSANDVLSTASDLSDASRKTASSAKEIAVATEEIAGGATSLAVEAEKGTDLTNNIDVQMKKVIEANQQLVITANDVEKASEQGTAYMGVLIQKTGMTEEMTRSMVEKVDALKESTGSIVKILDVLNNLMKQTNILSLNATIEAARAGAAGRGFMVIADEIRKLADQSRQSIEVVGQITGKIRGEIDETVLVFSDATPLFQEQIGSVKEANQIFLTVQGQMAQFVEKLDLVTDSISMLDQSQEVMAEAMTNVSAVAEESSATSEEVASLSSEQLSISAGMVRLSEKLEEVSHELKNSLSQFKIE